MVSDLGRVKSLNYRHTGEEEILSPAKNRKGYLQVGLYKDGKRFGYFVHRLVWEAFNGPVPEGMQVNHINERTCDNRLENLNLMSPKENTNWGTGIRRRSKTQSKMVEQYTLDGTHICTWFSARGVEREKGIPATNITACCRGKHKIAGGFKWIYAEIGLV